MLILNSAIAASINLIGAITSTFETVVAVILQSSYRKITRGY